MKHFELKKRRKALGLTQGKFGSIIGFSGGYISQVELGNKTPSDKFLRIADAELSKLEQQEVARMVAKGAGAIRFESGTDVANWRNNAGLTQQQLHILSGVSRNQIALIESGARPLSKKVREKLEGAAEVYRRDRSILAPVKGAAQSTIPVVGMAAVAHFDPSLSNLCDLLECTDERIPCICDNADELFGVRISGDSMAPKLQDDDVVAVSNTLLATGDVCIVLHRTDGLLCKQWYWRNGVVKLEALNEDGKTYEWTKEEFMREQPLVWRFKVESLIFRKF